MFAGVLLESDTAANVEQRSSSTKLHRVTPGSTGVSPDSIIAFVDAVEQKVGGLHSFMLLRHGDVVAEGWWAPYAPALPHMLYSLSKSFTSTAVGFAVSEKRLSVEDRVVSFFSDSLPANVDENLAEMRVKHLLTMNTGHEHDATGPVTGAKDGDWVRAFLSLPVEHSPGSKFVYNSAATYTLSAIVQKLTGMRVVDYLKPRLFDPLGIRGETWETCPKGINTGGWGLNVKTEDIARFGQCYLQKGKWQDRQVVPEAWVDAATAKQVPNGSDPASDWSQGYGYQFWRCRHNAFRGDGAFGQFCLEMPEQDAVLAITSGVGDMQAVLNAVWDHLLPGLQHSGGSSGSSAALKRRLSSLHVKAPDGNAASETSGRVSGKTYRLNANDEKLQSAVVEFNSNRCTLTLRGPSGAQQLVCGLDSWVSGQVHHVGPPRLGAPPAGKVAARGAWTNPNTYVMKVCYVETPYIETFTLTFNGDDLTIARKLNVAFGATDSPLLVGHSS